MFTVTSMLDLLSFFQRFGHLFPHPCSCEWQRRFFGKRYFGREHISTMIWLNMITLIHQPQIFPQMRKFPMFCSDVTRMCWTPGWIFLFRRKPFLLSSVWFSGISGTAVTGSRTLDLASIEMFLVQKTPLDIPEQKNKQNQLPPSVPPALRGLRVRFLGLWIYKLNLGMVSTANKNYLSYVHTGWRWTE